VRTEQRSPVLLQIELSLIHEPDKVICHGLRSELNTCVMKNIFKWMFDYHAEYHAFEDGVRFFMRPARDILPEAVNGFR
jgi:hypothetical protein